MKGLKKSIALLLVFVCLISSVTAVYAQEDVTEHIHNYTEKVLVKTTHTQNGLSRYECDCGYVYEEITFAQGHSYQAKTVVELTHEKNGLIRYECDCGDVYEEITFAQGHNHIAETVVELTHEKNGLIRYKCDCGDVYEEITFAKGHSYIPYIYVNVSHTQDGIMRYECDCGDYYDEVIESEGHNYVQEKIEPTCVDNGSEILRCTICEDTVVLRDPEIDPSATDLLAKGHDYVVVESVEPTQEEDGYSKHVCSVCQDTYISILEHDDKYVVEMYICAKRQISPLGHMWVYFQNKSDKTIEVGAYSLPAGEGVSVGVFGLTRSDGIGVYYNVEAYSANRYGLESVICMQEKLTESEMQKVSKRIKNSNFWEFIIFNCMGMAFSIWNSGSNMKLIPLIFPVFGRWQILLHDHQTEIDMYYPTVNQVYKQRGLGKNARLEKVSSGSLKNGI